MGKLNIFEIGFAHNSGVFFDGTPIDGHVTLELTEPMKMRGIKLNFEGRADVCWSESEHKKEVTTYSASEVYFRHDVLLFGNCSNTTELPAGRHTFPFQFQLPQGLPSSFESDYCCVRYVVKSNIDRPRKYDHKTKRPFTIISILDLNKQRRYQTPVQGSKEKTLCCLCCTSGPITANFYLDRSGYVPGEAIKLFADISNGAGRSMSKSYVDLKMITTCYGTDECKLFKTNNPTKSMTTVQKVARVRRPSIDPHSVDIWTGEELVIPPLPPSFLEGCKIIDVQYILQLNVDPSGPALDLEIPLEVIIGTIPLEQVVERMPPMPPPPAIGWGDGVAPSAPPREDLSPTGPPSGISNLPRPCFA